MLFSFWSEPDFYQERVCALDILVLGHLVATIFYPQLSLDMVAPRDIQWASPTGEALKGAKQQQKLNSRPQLMGVATGSTTWENC